MAATLAAARGAAGTNAPGGNLHHTPGEVACVSLFAVCAVFVLLSASKAPPERQEVVESVEERAAASQCGAAGSSAPGGALAQTLGEVLRASLGAFGAVLVRLPEWSNPFQNLDHFALEGCSKPGQGGRLQCAPGRPCLDPRQGPLALTFGCVRRF